MDQKCKFHCGVDGDVAAVRWTETLCQLLPTADSMKQEAQSKMSKVRVQRLIRSCDGCFMKRSACRSHRPISSESCDPPSTPPPIHCALAAALEEWEWCGEGHFKWDMHREGNRRTTRQQRELTVWFSYRPNTWLERRMETKRQPSVHNGAPDITSWRKWNK